MQRRTRKSKKNLPWEIASRPRFHSDMNLCTRAFTPKRDKYRSRAALKRELERGEW